MEKTRLDDFLVSRGFVKDKRVAFIAVTEGNIFVNGQKAVSPAQPVFSDAVIEVRSSSEYVGRGAYKLKAALDAFAIEVKGKVCVDIGAATGGFTEVLLQYGAKKVYAIDTARGKLALKIRTNPQVVVMEGVDVRDCAALPEKADIVAIDVSLVSLRGILPAVWRFLKLQGVVVALFKPQYETRDQKILRHGVIKVVMAREQLLVDFTRWVEHHGWKIKGTAVSPIRGSKGNAEYLFYLLLR